MTKTAFRILILVGSLYLWLPFCSLASDSGTNGQPEAAAADKPDAASDESLRAYLQIQEQIHEALLAIERNRQDSEDSASRTSKALAERLQVIENSLTAQRANELDAVQHANRTLVILVSSFAALGCLAVLLTAIFQWRAVNRFTAVSSALALANGSSPWRTFNALESVDNAAGRISSGEPINSRLLGAIERLEKRIQELERVSTPSLSPAPAATNILNLQPGDSARAPAAGQAASNAAEAAEEMLLKGQALLDAGQFEEAVQWFDKLLATEPRNAEALVKKGTALEQLRKPQEALDCYDRAISADSSMTIAYLHKGGLYNRMERFTEALACYEQALRTQETRRSG